MWCVSLEMVRDQFAAGQFEVCMSVGLQNILTRSNDWRSSPQICPRWRRRPACTSFRTRLPSSPLLPRSGSHYAGTPEGLQSRPAEGQSRRLPPGCYRWATEGKKKKTNWNPVVFKPGRSRRLRSCCLRRTCCRPVSLRTRGELCISPGRWGQRERPAAGWSRTSLRQTEQQQRWRSVDFESILRCSYHGKNHSTGLLLFVYCNSKIHLICLCSFCLPIYYITNHTDSQFDKRWLSVQQKKQIQHFRSMSSTLPRFPT